MARRSTKRPYGSEHVPLDVQRATGGRTVQDAPDGEWVVQRVRGSEREYRCPGCDQLVATGTPHVVAWRSDGWRDGLEDRRHWHGACFDARSRRGPTRRGGAPRTGRA